MLVSSLVRRTLALKAHRVAKVSDVGGRLVVELDRVRRRRLPCSGCGTKGAIHDRLAARRFRHVPCWGIPVELRYRPARVACRVCAAVKVEAIPWARGKSPLTTPLVVVLATWGRLLAWDVVARLFGVSWSTVRGAVGQAVAYGLERRDDSAVRYLGIDEISRRKGHVYHTQVYDLEAKRLLWSGEGRKAATLERFFDEWGAERSGRIEGICCDMWAPYMEVIAERASQAVVVFDKFHVVRHLLEAVNDVRKLEARALRATEPELLAGTRYIWLKNPWNLTLKQRGRLRHLERLNLKISRAYLLKELFRELWSYKRKAWAKRFLDRWFWWATHSRLKPLRDFAWMLRRHQDGILAYIDLGIDNGAVEAMNNNAKAIAHRARGFRTEKTFTLAQLHCLGKLQLPETTHRFA